MLKNILVHVPSERLIRPVADSAISLAVMCKAHLDAVSIGFETTNVGLALDGGAALAAVFEIDHESALARVNAALAVFETEARNAGITYGLLPLTGNPAETAATVGALGTALRFDGRAAARARPRYVRQHRTAGNTFSVRRPGHFYSIHA